MTASTRSRFIVALLLMMSLIIAPVIRAQDTPVDPNKTTAADSKLPEAIRALMPAVVSVTRVEPAGDDPDKKPLTHAGIVVDPSGYIVIPNLPSTSRPKLFVVRFADDRETMGEMAAIDEGLKIGVLKVERPQLLAAVSLTKAREARVDERVLLVPSPRSKDLRGGRVRSNTSLGDDGFPQLIQADVTVPLSEFGSLMVSEAGEPIGLLMASRADQSTSVAMPAKAVLRVIEAAINKPKDVSLVTMPASPPAIDLKKPVQLSLQPATPEMKTLVEGFAERGAKVLEFDVAAKRLRIEAPPVVLDEIGKQLAQVGSEAKQPNNDSTSAATPSAPKELRELAASIVTVMRIDPKTGLPSPNPNGMAGVIVDERGYILTPFMEGLSKAKPFKVRLASGQEFVAETAAQSRLLMVLKIVSPQPLTAVSLKKIGVPQKGDEVYVVASPAAKTPSAGRVTNPSAPANGKDGFTATFISADFNVPLGEVGSLVLSARGEPIGISRYKAGGENPGCLVLPMQDTISIIEAATKEKVAESPVTALPMPVAQGEMPDLTGQWTFTPSKEVSEMLGAKPNRFLFARSRIAGIDFEYLSMREPTVPAVKLKWEPGTRRFRTVAHNDPASVNGTFELSADGTRLTARGSMPADKAKQLAAELKVSDKDFTEKFLQQEWQRDGATASAAAGPVEADEPDDPKRLLQVKLQPATPLAKSLVELFAPRGAKVLQYEEGKLLGIEAPADVMEDLAKMLDQVGREYQKQSSKPGVKDPVPQVINGVTTFALRNVPADECAKQLRALKFKSLITTDERTNSILVSGDSEELQVIQTILLRLDDASGTPVPHVENSLAAKTIHLPRVTQAESPTGLVILGSDHSARGISTRDVAPQRSALPDTPAAKQLAEQLAAQESAAASEAATIRQLQSNGQAERNKQAIAEHQRKLKNLLSTAFDLKLQLEVVQVKVLQDRVNRLERQVFQRGDLREKIITRRASELIEGDALKWTPSVSVHDRATEPFAANLNATIVVDLYSGSKVLIEISKNPQHTKLVQTLNALPQVQVNFREVQTDDPRAIISATVTDSSQRCLRESQQTQKESTLRDSINAAIKAAGIKTVRWEETVSSVASSRPVLQSQEPLPGAGNGPAVRPRTDSGVEPDAATTNAPLPTPEELKAKLKPFAEPVKAAMQRVRDLEPTFFKDGSNLKVMQHALQELAQARAAWKPHQEALYAIYEEHVTEQQLAALTEKGLENRVAALTEKLGQGEATEAEVRAAMTALRNSPRTTASLKERHQKYEAVFSEFFELAFRSDDELPEPIKSALNRSQPSPHPKQHPAFAMAWLETALQSRLELVSLTELDLPFTKALRVNESTHPKGDLQAGDLVIALLGEPIESLDQAVASFEAAKRRDSSDEPVSVVMKGGLSGQRLNHLLGHLPNWAESLSPGAPASVLLRFEVKVRRGEGIESESLSGTCVGPDGLIVIPIATKLLEPNAPILSNSRNETAVIIGSDDRHGLTLLKLGGPPRPWVKCWSAQPKLDQQLGYYQYGRGTECVVTAIDRPYPEPLTDNGAFHIKTLNQDFALRLGDQVVTNEGALLGLVIDLLADQAEKKTRYHSAVVIPAIHIQKLIDDYRDKQLAGKAQGVK